ncbi:MAG: geranyltranstransferase [Rickettsiaceae bacterium]|jgi:farnesyl diphosphate synthase|nr:geranyltranstransferase [Rickettsiaceae bacterium]
MSDLDKVLQDISESLNEKMDALLPDLDACGQTRLYEAMRYSSLSSGKRLRPFLTVTTANLFGVSKSSSLQLAAAIEFLHTYSLIHDDLPAMDNDDMRRGQPSCHIKFDQATAILAGDALLTLVFEILADRSTHSSNTVRCELITCVARAAGARGMVGGQMVDLISENKDMSINEIIHLQRLKTGELFAVSCEGGAILGNAAMNLRNLVRGYAHDIGLAFQITDDLLDSEANDNGSNSRTDKSSGKATFVTAMGAAKAKEQAKILADQAVRHLHVFGKKADLLRELAYYVVNRRS